MSINPLFFLQNSGRFIQLLLGCAVNCDAKEQYIEGIVNMEESLQMQIMQAITELQAHQVRIMFCILFMHSNG